MIIPFLDTYMSEEANAGAPAPTSQAESYDANGILETSEDLFLSPEEMSPEENGDIHGENEDDNRGESDEKPQEEAKKEEPEKKEEESKEGEEPKLLAGKYKSKEELESAFKELGGDPSKYQTPETLEEAYSVRQSEYTRFHQEQSTVKQIETEKAQILQERTAKITETIGKINKTIEDKLNEVDWSQVEDAKDIGRLIGQTLAPVIGESLMNAQPALTATEVQQMQQDHQKDLQVRHEIDELMSEIPRLKNDEIFGNAFATYVAGLKANNNLTSLKDAFSKFVGTQQKINDDAANTNEAKALAQATGKSGSENNLPAKKSPEDSILDDILSSQKEDKDKFGFF